MTQPLTIYVIQSAHTDIGYTHPQEQIMRMYLEHYERVLALCRATADAPELAKLGADVRLFDPADANAVTGRTQAPREGLTFVTQPILWSPDPGVEVLVVTGRSKTASFVLALFPLPSGKYKTASYFVMLGDVAPVALAYNPSKRRELQWTTCWGCSGETGAVSFREDRRIVIVQL